MTPKIMYDSIISSVIPSGDIDEEVRHLGDIEKECTVLTMEDDNN